MKVLFYSYKDFEESFFKGDFSSQYEMECTTERLSMSTAGKAKGFETICVFTSDDVTSPVIEELYKQGVRYIAIRAAGYDNVDIKKAMEMGIQVANVPEYSPYAIAEHALALMLVLYRRLILSDHQMHQYNFSVDNLVGINLHRKTIGIIGTGRIGSTLAKILKGFCCKVLAYDIHDNKELEAEYDVEFVPIATLCRESDIISIHTPLTPGTRNLVNQDMIELMKRGVMIINTSRGGCLNTEDVIRYLKKGHIGYFGADVYEKEKGLFFYDWSGKDIRDDNLRSLLEMPNVILTPHQAFCTKEALTNIAMTTWCNIDCWARKLACRNELTKEFAEPALGN